MLNNAYTTGSIPCSVDRNFLVIHYYSALKIHTEDMYRFGLGGLTAGNLPCLPMYPGDRGYIGFYCCGRVGQNNTTFSDGGGVAQS